MKNFRFLLFGVLFGIILVKSEVVSWYRIQEMFRFQSFHMYGIMASAIAVGAVSVLLLKSFRVKALGGEPIDYPVKRYNHGLWLGGFLFGMGWALTGACPGPMFAHIGSGVAVAAVMIASAVAGTWTYSYFRGRLPH